MLSQAKEDLHLCLPNSPLLNLRWKEGSQLPESPPLHFRPRPTSTHRPHLCVGGQASYSDSVRIRAEQTCTPSTKSTVLGPRVASLPCLLGLLGLYFLRKLNTLKDEVI